MTGDRMERAVAGRLEALGASHDVVVYAESFGDDHARFWAECPRGDWLLAIAVRAERPREQLARAALSIVELACDYLPDDDHAAHAVLEATRGCVGAGTAISSADIDALDHAADAAPDPTVSLARQAVALTARVLGDATAEGRALADLAMVPSLIAQAAAYDAGDCAMQSAARHALAESADRVRAVIPGW